MPSSNWQKQTKNVALSLEGLCHSTQLCTHIEMWLSENVCISLYINLDLVSSIWIAILAGSWISPSNPKSLQILAASNQSAFGWCQSKNTSTWMADFLVTVDKGKVGTQGKVRNRHSLVLIESTYSRESVPQAYKESFYIDIFTFQRTIFPPATV
jgi:hypothetical protein